MRVCFCVSSLFLLLVLFEEQRFVLLCPRGRKKERRRKKTSSSAFKFSRIFKNFYLLTTRKSAQQNTHCFHAPRSIQVRVQKFLTYKRLKERATEHSLLSRAALNSGKAFKTCALAQTFVRTPLKSPFFKCLKTLSQIRKNECIVLKIHKSP